MLDEKILDQNLNDSITYRDFFHALGYKDSDTIHLRHFDDTKQDERKAGLRSAKLSDFDTEVEFLKTINDMNCGIYFTVNAGGQRDIEITRIAANFAEIDDLPFEEQLKIINSFPLEPSIIIKTRRSLHVYYLLEPGTESVKDFRGIQERFIKFFHSDPIIKNESRVMRLYGFNHCKQNPPVMVKLIKFDPQIRYTKEQLEAVLPEIKPEDKEQEKKRDNLADGEKIGEGGRHGFLLKALGKIYRRNHDLLDDKAILMALKQVCFDKCEDPAGVWKRDAGNFRDQIKKMRRNPQYDNHGIYDKPDVTADDFDDGDEEPDEGAAKYQTRHNASVLMKPFLQGITDGIDTPCTPTGFKNLDDILDGGLYPGLYIMGAISSLGKTTLLLQIASQIAAQGYDVLYFSLEMATTELISKSISRETYLNCMGATDNAKTARGITDKRRYKGYSQTEKELIQTAAQAYSQYGANIYFFEAIGDIGAKEIRKAVQKHKQYTGRTPLVFIDYLQIMKPYDVHMSDKQNTDHTVLELKHLSRDENLVIFGVSSFNRDNYAKEVSMASFKESGAIEYGSDVLIGLQPQGMKPGVTKNDEKHNIAITKSCKAANDRHVEISLLKNRNGRVGVRTGFIYHALFNDFEVDNSYSPYNVKASDFDEEPDELDEILDN